MGAHINAPVPARAGTDHGGVPARRAVIRWARRPLHPRHTPDDGDAACDRRLGAHPELLAATFGIDQADLSAKAVSDPRAAVAVDVAAIKDNPFLPADFIVSGLLYDVRIGLIETVVAPSLLRESAAA